MYWKYSMKVMPRLRKPAACRRMSSLLNVDRYTTVLMGADLSLGKVRGVVFVIEIKKSFLDLAIARQSFGSRPEGKGLAQHISMTFM